MATGLRPAKIVTNKDTNCEANILFTLWDKERRFIDNPSMVIHISLAARSPDGV